MRPNVDQALLELEGVDPPLMCSWNSTAYGQSDVVTYSTYQGKTGNGHGRFGENFVYFFCVCNVHHEMRGDLMLAAVRETKAVQKVCSSQIIIIAKNVVMKYNISIISGIISAQRPPSQHKS